MTADSEEFPVELRQTLQKMDPSLGVVIDTRRYRPIGAFMIGDAGTDQAWSHQVSQPEAERGLVVLCQECNFHPGAQLKRLPQPPKGFKPVKPQVVAVVSMHCSLNNEELRRVQLDSLLTLPSDPRMKDVALILGGLDSNCHDESEALNFLKKAQEAGLLIPPQCSHRVLGWDMDKKSKAGKTTNSWNENANSWNGSTSSWATSSSWRESTDSGTTSSRHEDKKADMPTWERREWAVIDFTFTAFPKPCGVESVQAPIFRAHLAQGTFNTLKRREPPAVKDCGRGLSHLASPSDHDVQHTVGILMRQPPDDSSITVDVACARLARRTGPQLRDIHTRKEEDDARWLTLSSPFACGTDGFMHHRLASAAPDMNIPRRVNLRLGPSYLHERRRCTEEEISASREPDDGTRPRYGIFRQPDLDFNADATRNWCGVASRTVLDSRFWQDSRGEIDRMIETHLPRHLVTRKNRQCLFSLPEPPRRHFWQLRTTHHDDASSHLRSRWDHPTSWRDYLPHDGGEGSEWSGVRNAMIMQLDLLRRGQ